MSIDVRASMDVDVPADAVFRVVRDLATYPQWLDIVHQVEPNESGSGQPGWNVELRAKIGPFARSKRLRMVRTVDEHPTRVTFERSELDGKKHARWVLTSEISAHLGTTTLRVHLHYGGSLFDGGVVERVLADQIESGKIRLSRVLADS